MLGLYINLFRPGIPPSRVSGKQGVCRWPLKSRACQVLVHFLVPAVPPTLSLPPPLECQREAPGPQWDSLRADSSSRCAGAAVASYRWADAAGSPAAQQAPAGQSRERRWQSGAHPG